jgi:hemerythrin superfamily protein
VTVKEDAMEPSADRSEDRIDYGITLAKEHAGLEALFQSVVEEARAGDPAGLRARWSRFERELEAHMALEEREILPTFAREYPEEARAVRDEHARIRAGLAEMGLDLDLHCLQAERVNGFIERLRAHAHREEALLYPWISRGRR